MNLQTLQTSAGFTSTTLFVTANLPRLLKAYKRKDLKSYSFGHILLGSFGNLIYWFYVVSLPFGPVWILQGFFTLSSVLLLFSYLRYEKAWSRKISSLEAR
jgi:uncharacterized protein with PQ loop repeat